MRLRPRWSPLLATTFLGVATAVGVLAACSSGDTGPAGATGPASAAGPAGPAGPAGSNGTSGEAGAPGGSVVVSAHAKHGLDISPVPLNLAGKTGAQIEQIGQGSYLVNAIGVCSQCHSPDPTKFMAGGIPFAIGPGGAAVFTRNLTPDPTTGMKLTEDQFIASMRTGADFKGVGAGGTPSASLIVMPWFFYKWLSTPDLKAIYAYLKVIPPQNNMVMADNMRPVIPPQPYDDKTFAAGDESRPLPPEVDPLGQPIPDPDNFLRGLAIVPLTSAALPPPTDSNAAAFGRGSYLVNAGTLCAGCHTHPFSNMTGTKYNTAMYLTGGEVFNLPPPLQPIFHAVRSMSANLVGAKNGWFNNPTISFQEFMTAITQGVHSDEPPPRRPIIWPMPATDVFRNMELGDLQSIYVYVRSIAQASAAGKITPTDKATQDAARYCTSAADCKTGEKCDATNHECYDGPCTTDADCGVCQTCSTTCQLPVATSACVASGI